MTAPYTARCACGSVGATVRGEPLGVRQCWCRQCQQIAAGGPTNNAMFLAADVELTGELGCHSGPAASGNILRQYFCARCGVPVYGQSSARLHLMSLRLGFLDEGHGLAPSAAIWLDDAPDWARIDPAMEKFERQPPPPPSTS